MDDLEVGDEGAFLYQTEDGETLIQSIRTINQGIRHILVFDKEGRWNVEEQYDQFTATASKVVQEMKIFGIVGFVDLTFAKYVVVVTARDLAAKYQARPIWSIRKVALVPVHRSEYMQLDDEEEERDIQRSFQSIFSSGHVYFSLDIDLSQSLVGHLAVRTENDLTLFYDNMSKEYVWNYLLAEPLFSEPNCYPFVFPVMCGSVSSQTVHLQTHQAEVHIISRVNRLGFGYQKRGLAFKEGQVTGQIETEILVHHEHHLLSFSMLRGSIPLMWSQDFSAPFSYPVHRTCTIDTSRCHLTESFLGMRMHLKGLLLKYDRPIHIIDLVNDSTQHTNLSTLFESTLARLDEEDGTKYTHIPYVDNAQLLKRIQIQLDHDEFSGEGADLNSAIENMGFCRRMVDDQSVEKRLREQCGVFRLNAVDVIDEVDVAMFAIAKVAIHNMLVALKLCEKGSECKSMDSALTSLFSKNADHLSQIMTGADSLALPLRETNSLWLPLYQWRAWRIRLIRGYMILFVSGTRQDDLSLFMRNYASFSPHEVKQTSRKSVSLLTKENAALAEARSIRRRLMLMEARGPWYVSYFLLFKKFFAPHTVRTTLQLLCACFWLVIFWFYTSILKVERRRIVKASLSSTNMQELPQLNVRKMTPISPIPNFENAGHIRRPSNTPGMKSHYSQVNMRAMNRHLSMFPAESSTGGGDRKFW